MLFLNKNSNKNDNNNFYSYYSYFHYYHHFVWPLISIFTLIGVIISFISIHAIITLYLINVLIFNEKNIVLLLEINYMDLVWAFHRHFLFFVFYIAIIIKLFFKTILSLFLFLTFYLCFSFYYHFSFCFIFCLSLIVIPF